MTENTAELTALISELEDQQARLQFDRFTHSDGIDLGLLLVELARERTLGITIDVTKGEQQIFHAALPGTTADNDDWVARKNRTVRRFAESSWLVGRRFAAAGTDFNEKTGLPFGLYVAHGGCFPIQLRGTGMIGTVTVSGLPQHEDHALVVEAIEAVLGLPAA